MRERWGWVGVAFCALALTMGVRSAFGVYVLPWEAEFGWSRGQIASVSSVSLLTYGLGNVVAGPAAERFGVAPVVAVSLVLVAVGLAASAAAQGLGWLYVSYGVVASAGFSGASHVTASVAVRHRVPDARRSFVLSVVVAGMSAGQMVVTPLQVLGVPLWGWRGVLVGLAAAALVLAALAAAALRPEAAPEGRRAHEAPRGLGAGALLRDPWFWLFLAPYAVCGFTDSGLVDNHLVPYARGVGVSEAALAAAFSALALANLAGTVAAGFLADRLGRGPVLCGLYLWRGASFAVLSAGGAGAVWAFALLFGATHFATIAPTNTLALTLFQHSAPGLAVGLASFVHQLGAAAGALAGGVAFDRWARYEPAFALAVALLGASAAALAWVHRAEAGSAPRRGVLARRA